MNRRTGLRRAPAALPVPAASAIYAARELAGDAALLLLVGGLAMLALIVALVLLQNLFPVRSSAAVRDDKEPVARQLRPIYGPDEAPPPQQPKIRGPRGVEEPVARPTVDRPVDQLVELHIGEPRVLRHRPHYTRIRLYGCRSCDPQSRRFRDRLTGCAFEQGEIESAFQTVYGSQAVAREAHCRMRGDPECEYEVRH